MKKSTAPKKSARSISATKATKVNRTPPQKTLSTLPPQGVASPTKLHPKRQLLKADNSIETMQLQLAAALRRADFAERETAKLQMELHKVRTAYCDLEKIHQVQTDILYAMRDEAV